MRAHGRYKRLEEDFGHLFNERCTVSCAGGWFDLIYRLTQRINALIPVDERAAFSVVQVKEKFGTLSYYLWGTESSVKGSPGIWDSVQALVREAGKESARTCEMCGASGQLRRTMSWIRTLCDDCELARHVNAHTSRLQMLVLTGLAITPEKWNALKVPHPE